jgi:hypothetical protein
MINILNVCKHGGVKLYHNIMAQAEQFNIQKDIVN